jgi:hypothetical protein
MRSLRAAASPEPLVISESPRGRAYRGLRTT